MFRKVSSIMLLALAALMVLTGCIPAPGNNGSVKINVSDAASKAIVPSDDWSGLDIDRYEIIAKSAADAEVHRTTVDSIPASVEMSLPVGRYYFEAQAYSEETIVADAKSDVIAISSKSMPEVTLVLDLSGIGNIEVDYELSDEVASIENIKAYLISLDSSEEKEITVDANNKKVSTEVAAGSYLIKMEADVKNNADGISTKFAKADIVYVESGKTSRALWTISYSGNNASITLDSNVGKPVVFTIVTTEDVEYDSIAKKYTIPEDKEVAFAVNGLDEELYNYKWTFNDDIISESSSAVIKCEEVALGKLCLLVSSKQGTSYGYGYNQWTVESSSSINLYE